MTTQTMWIVFTVLVVGTLVLDLGVFHRKSHVVKIKEALIWTAVWIALAIVFMGFVYYWRGTTAALEFLTAYLIEESLSVDNLFVFLMIFSHFRVPTQHQHKILFWGIVGAVVMRAIFIGVGVALIQQFHWVIYVFGVILIVSGIKMAVQDEEEIDFDKNFVLKTLRRIMPISNSYDGGNFFTVKNGKRTATLFFAVLLIVETTDVMFAVDSIPAVLAVSKDPFIIYSSNVFAILGLRSLFFALAGMLEYFHYLNYGLCVILCFVGVKMLASGFFHMPVAISLGVIVAVLTFSVVASLIWPEKKNKTSS